MATVLVKVGVRTVPLAQLADARAKAAFTQAASDIDRKLSRIPCPVHKTPPKNVRLTFDAAGGIDLGYDSCCDELGKAVQKQLG